MTTAYLPSQPTPFIGRQDELAEITRLLNDPTCRLLTLVGPGGIGKTRLAIEAVTPQASLYPDGVYFVPLQPLTSPDFMVSTIADALNLTFYGEREPKTQLLNYLHEKYLLLILDNFEHLLDGVDLLPEILERAPGVKLLITSRERLRLREEWVVDVRGLTFPENGHNTKLDDYSAVQLFVQSARRVGYTPEDTASIVRICQMVEGMPLAIELAAAWVRAIPCAQIAREIEHSLDILTTTTRNMPDKHRSMRAAFEHSWNLLPEDERAVFRKLSVFRGGFMREAAEHVAGASLQTLAALVDKSLVRVDATGRYDLHELLGQYAHEKLTEADEAKAILDRHRDYFLAFAERAEPEFFGANQLHWLKRVLLEHNNFWVAIGWSLECKEVTSSLRVILSLHLFWSVLGYHREAGRRLVDILSLPDAKVRTIVRASALYAAGNFQAYEGNFAVARALLEEASAIAREVGDQRQLVLADRSLGYLLYCLGESEAAELLLEENLLLVRNLQDRFGTAWSLMFLGDVVLEQGNVARAQKLYQESVGLFRELEDKMIIAYPLRRLGLVMCRYQDYERAEALYHEGLELNFVARAHREVMGGLVGLAGLAITIGHVVYAAKLLGAAETLLNDIDGRQMWLPDQHEYERHVKTVRNQLDTPTFDSAWAEGHAMTMEQAVAFALEGRVTLGQPQPPDKQPLPDPLTERELEILRLLASGLSTREVAQQLFLSYGTVRWYLKAIYSKLSVHSRTQAVARAHELKLLA